MTAAQEPSRIRTRLGSPVATTLNGVFRRGILLATQNRVVARGVRRYGMRLGAARFVAGETFDEVLPVLHGLTAQGLRTNTTLLGEGVREAAAAAAVAETYCTVLDRLAAAGLPTNIALKLTHLGLDLGEAVAEAHLRRIVAHAAAVGNFIRIDMEESARVDPTLRIYRRLRADGVDNVGVVLQAMLYRSGRDLEALLPLRPNLRLVKGAYLESPQVAYPKKREVDRNYLALAERALLADGFTALATHDERLIVQLLDFTARHGIARERFEFQMLYGIRPQLQRELVRQGYRVRVATPYGADWYCYLMRRLAERPANVLFLLRNLACDVRGRG